jgi:3'-5' exonuclease
MAGQIKEVASFIAKANVLNTYRLWLIYELFRGSITAKEFDWSERQIRDFVETRNTANPHLCEALGLPSKQ